MSNDLFSHNNSEVQASHAWKLFVSWTYSELKKHEITSSKAKDILIFKSIIIKY